MIPSRTHSHLSCEPSLTKAKLSAALFSGTCWPILNMCDISSQVHTKFGTVHQGAGLLFPRETSVHGFCFTFVVTVWGTERQQDWTHLVFNIVLGN